MSSQVERVPVDSACPAVRYQAPVADRAYCWLLLVLIAAYIAGTAWRACALSSPLGPGGFDTAIFQQAAWLIAHNDRPFVTIRGLHILADHFSVVMYLLAPIMWIWSGPCVMPVLQCAALGLGAVPMYALARLCTGSPAVALLFAAAYLASPTAQEATCGDFHPECLAPALLLAALYFKETGRWPAFYLALFIAAMTKETIGIVIVAMGLCMLLHSRRHGIATMIAGLTVTVVAFQTIRWFNQGLPSPYWQYYTSYGASPSAILWNLASHPVRVLAAVILDSQKREYLIGFLYPVSFLSLVAPDILVPAVPAVLLGLLTNQAYTYSLGSQQSLIALPFVYAAAAVAFGRLQSSGNRLTTGFFLGCLCAAVLTSALDLPAWTHVSRPRAGLAVEIRQVLQRIPCRASVSAPAPLLPSLCDRRSVYLFPNPLIRMAWGGSCRALRQTMGQMTPRYTPEQLSLAAAAAPVDYVVLCPGLARFPVPDRLYATIATAVMNSPDYGVVTVSAHVVLLRAGADHRRGLELLSEVRYRRGTGIHTPLGPGFWDIQQQ